jgi:hypothetical protein
VAESSGHDTEADQLAVPDGTPEDGPIAADIDAAAVDGRPGTPPAPARLGLQRLRRPALALVTLSWAPLAASALAVVLSLASIYVSTREPEVVMILPDTVRLVVGRQAGGSYLYLQPSFVSAGVNDRVEVIADMSLRAQSDDGADPVELDWKQVVALETDANGVLSYRYEADAVPLLVGPRSAAAPLSLFEAPQGWFFEEGTYAFTLEADRVVSSAPLAASFDVTLDADHIAFLDDPVQDRFLAFSIEPSA